MGKGLSKSSSGERGEDEGLDPVERVAREAERTQKLNAAKMDLKAVPRRFFEVEGGVKELWLQENALSSLHPDSEELWSNWEQVELLYANGNRLKELPEAMRTMERLQELNLSANPDLSSLPPSIASRWSDLRQIYLNELPSFEVLPGPAVSVWKNLRILHCNGCRLQELPDQVVELCNLTMVSLNSNLIQSLPSSIASWTKVEKLFLNDNLLTDLPPAIGS